MEQFLTAVENHKNTCFWIAFFVIILFGVAGDAIAKIRKGND